MKNFCRLTSLLAVIFPAIHVNAQYYYYNSRFYESPVTWELTASLAGMNCLTDIGMKREASRYALGEVDWKATRPGVAISGHMLFQNKIGCRLQATYGKVTAHDTMHRNRRMAPARYNRHLQFESIILEAALLGELYPLTLLTAADHPAHLLSPYLLAGIGWFHFNPVAKTAKGDVRLAPLRTEGQGFPEYPGRKPYDLNQFNLPFGLGLKYEISAIVICSIELLYRKLFTDYLDDVSTTYIDPGVFYKYFAPKQALLAATLSNRQRKNLPYEDAGTIRGNPGNNDAYLSFNVKMAVAVGREKR